MKVAVIVPWRGGDKARERGLRWTLARWVHRHPRWRVVVAEAPPGPWVKALAVMPAVEARPTADIVVVADGDVWCDATAEAVEAVAEGAAWAVPHDKVRRFGEAVTGAVLAGYEPADVADAELVQRPYTGVEGGGIVVARREVIVDVPLDARFVGWGGEDHAHGYAVRTLYGPPRRGEAPLYHLHHPPQRRESRQVGSIPSERLRRRYRAALGDPEAMRHLVEEAKAWRTSASS